VRSGETKKPTIRDVAAAAGVSYQTVSRVINDRPDVAVETRRRVLEVIEQLDYQPSAVARGLASRRTRTLGLITEDFTDYFFMQAIVGAEAEARRHGYYFILGSTQRNPDDEPEYLRLLTEREVDGILFARPSTEGNAQHVRWLIERKMPLVTTSYSIPGLALMVVDVDNIDGGRQAAECLIEAGHRNIAMIAGPPGWKSVRDRSEGCWIALDAAGLSGDPTWTEHGDWSYEGGYNAARRLLERGVPATAFFCHNDRMAIGAMRALREAGRDIPNDVALIGYDDTPPAAYAYPPLTTIHQPMQEVGRLAAQLLLRMIEDPDIERRETLIKPHLVRRASV
jgi:LacI family repressor for deo operon, udp, cdd, tsx, nupC, and nupG